MYFAYHNLCFCVFVFLGMLHYLLLVYFCDYLSDFKESCCFGRIQFPS